ncbi:MAG TPA: glycosyltransferase family 4 protein [Actinospica sp.]|nr:glycosyltransferase family 4 protein [Actinospica sp.]
MRVVLVLGPSTGGIGTHVRALAEHCVARGDQVVVVGPPSTEARFHFTATGARFVPPTRLRRALKRADVVHSHGFKAAALVGVALTFRRAPRHVVTLHNEPPALGRPVVRRPDVVLGASADLVDRARRLGARTVALCPVPAPPLDPPTRPRTEIRRALAVGEEESLLLTVGRLAPQKALPVLLDAAAGLADLPVRLAIAGEGPERAALTARIESGNLPVTLLGHRADVADLLLAADVFVLCSHWEARALVVQEALRAGVPVVTTAVGGLPDLVGDAAILVPPDDPGALARELRRVLTNPALRDELRAAGPARAATWPTSDEALAVARAWYAATPIRPRRSARTA